MRYAKILGLVAVVGVLAACGNNPGEQAIFGAGAGAATAAAVGGDQTDVAIGALAGGDANVAYCKNYPSRC